MGTNWPKFGKIDDISIYMELSLSIIKHEHFLVPTVIKVLNIESKGSKKLLLMPLEFHIYQYISNLFNFDTF